MRSILKLLYVPALSLMAMVALSPIASATPIPFTSNPFPQPWNPDPAGLFIGGDFNSGTLNLTPGVSQTDTVWAWLLFGNPQVTFSNDAVGLNLVLNGVSGSVPVLASGVQNSGTYTFVPNGTIQYTLPGIGIVDVTAIGATTTINDPAHAGPTQASFLLHDATSVPEPGSLALVLAGLAILSVFVVRQRARG